MQKKALELSLYVAGAGAFGVFLRWLQVMIAFNDLGLVNRSAFNVLLPLFLAAAAAVFLRFLQQDEKAHLFVPEDFSEALGNTGRLYAGLSWVAGAIMIVGALALLSKSETAKYVRFLRVLSAMAALTGVCVPLTMAMANREEKNRTVLCLLTLVPVLFFAAWLIYIYRVNSINSVRWAYVPEIGTVILSMCAFARIAGFAYDSPKGKRARFDAMLAATLCLMSLADERYTGMQLMYLATAAMLMLYNWAMICNLEERRPQPKRPPQDGFERL